MFFLYSNVLSKVEGKKLEELTQRHFCHNLEQAASVFWKSGNLLKDVCKNSFLTVACMTVWHNGN